MVNKKVIKFSWLSCAAFLLCLSALCLTGCQTAEQACKKTADTVVEADQWFRDKLW